MSKAKQEWPANEITKTEAEKKRNIDRGFWLNRKGVLPCLIILEILAIVYDAFVNDSRIIQPVDFSTYLFLLSDLPLIVMTAVFVVYVFYMVIRMLVYQRQNRMVWICRIFRLYGYSCIYAPAAGVAIFLFCILWIFRLFL